MTRFLQTGRLLLGDDMGLGKTTQAAAASHALFHSGKVRRGLVISPASLKSQWLREWRNVTDVPAMIVEGSPEQRKEQYSSCKRGFLIMNYEQLLRDIAMVQAFAPDMVVLDEGAAHQELGDEDGHLCQSAAGALSVGVDGYTYAESAARTGVHLRLGGRYGVGA